MKLSDLIKLAGNSDPEILIVEDLPPRDWAAFPVDKRKYPEWRGSFILLAPDVDKRPELKGKSR